MNRIAVAALLLLLSVVAVARSGAPPSKLALLEGSWSGTISGVASTALPAHVTYTPPTGGVVLGTTKVLDGQGRAVYFEFERFTETRLYPYPGGKAATGFALAEATRDRLVFTNPAKDWPRRLEYRRVGRRLVITASQPGTKVLRLDLKRP